MSPGHVSPTDLLTLQLCVPLSVYDCLANQTGPCYCCVHFKRSVCHEFEKTVSSFTAVEFVVLAVSFCFRGRKWSSVDQTELLLCDCFFVLGVNPINYAGKDVPLSTWIYSRGVLPWHILDAYATLRKATVGFVMPVRPSVWNNSALTWRIFVKFWNLNIFRNFVEEIRFTFKSDSSDGHFTWIPVHLLCLYSAEFFLESKMFEINVVEQIKIHSLCSVTFFFSRKSCRLWDNVEKYDRARQATDGNIIRRMRFACCITKATDAQLRMCKTHCFSAATVVTRTQYIICLVQVLVHISVFLLVA